MVRPGHPGNGQSIDQPITYPIAEEVKAGAPQPTDVGLKRVLGHFDRLQHPIHNVSPSTDDGKDASNHYYGDYPCADSQAISRLSAYFLPTQHDQSKLFTTKIKY